MYKLLRNKRGNIAIAMALALVGVMSGITMATLAYKDSIDVRYDIDAVQELHLLRSETSRGLNITSLRDESGEGFTLPSRTVKITSSNSKRTFTLKTKVMRENVSTGGGFYFSSGYSIKTLGEAYRGTGSTALFGTNLSIVKKYGEKGIRRSSFAGYHYFTDNDLSPAGQRVYFYGLDEVHGKVHSNTDIWIKQFGAGNNNGWPTFFDQVYTSGVIQSFNGTPPYAQVFRSGYWERVNKLDFNPSASLIRAHGTIIGPAAYDPNRILFVTVTGGSYTSWMGQVINFGPDTTDVWTQYPPRTAPYRFRNRYTKYDTMWSQGPSGPSLGHSNIVFSKLWLKGRFQGSQTWCSVDTLYLNNDCLLTNTQKGQCPDGTVPGSQLNRQDFLGIVSEKSIVVQYGYRDPQDSLRYKPNCEGDAEGIWIYAALCALGDGDGDSFRDGVFTFEYQHPHPSTPAYRLPNNTYVWDKIDMHRRKYPQTASAPWPPNIDYPWYNPLWPEGRPYMERGKIHLWGSVAQRRRGFVHRSTNDTEWPSGGVWNIPIDFCGGTSGAAVTDPVLGFVMQGVNAPLASGAGVGYNKDYNFDNRYSYTTPPDFPEVHVKGGLTPFESESWVFRRPPNQF